MVHHGLLLEKINLKLHIPDKKASLMLSHAVNFFVILLSFLSGYYWWPIASQYPLFLYRPRVSYCKHVWYSGSFFWLQVCGLEYSNSQKKFYRLKAHRSSLTSGRQELVTKYLSSLACCWDSPEACSARSPLYLHWNWAPVAHSRNQLISAHCIGFLPFCDSLLVFPWIAFQVHSNHVSESALR